MWVTFLFDQHIDHLMSSIFTEQILLIQALLVSNVKFKGIVDAKYSLFKSMNEQETISWYIICLISNNYFCVICTWIPLNKS